mgnify:FL=1
MCHNALPRVGVCMIHDRKSDCIKILRKKNDGTSYYSVLVSLKKTNGEIKYIKYCNQTASPSASQTEYPNRLTARFEERSCSV